MKKALWIIIGSIAILILLSIISLIFMKPFLHYYANQTGPQKKYLKERTDIFGNNLPVDEAAGYEGEFGARFEFTEAEWAMIEKEYPTIGMLVNFGRMANGLMEQLPVNMYFENCLRMMKYRIWTQVTLTVRL